MTTSSAFENVEASVQVAHALSTNALSEEFDYFTAVDDLSGETGAGMIGDVEFNSSTYYKYLNVHWEKLVENLGGDVATARKAVLHCSKRQQQPNPPASRTPLRPSTCPILSWSKPHPAIFL
jgi:20S proteasome alpha/beta subunit